MNQSEIKPTGLPSKKPLKALLSLAISVGILVLLSFRVNIDEIGRILHNAWSWQLLGATALVLLGHIFLVSDRWRQVLMGMGVRITIWEAILVRMGCTPMKLLFPFKSAELLKPLYLSNQKQTPFTVGISSVIFDKISVILSMVPFIIVASILARRYEFALIAGLVVVGAGLIYISAFRKILLGVLSIFGKNIHGFFEKLINAYIMVPPGRALIVIGYSTIIYVLELLLHFACFKGAGVDVTLTRAFTAIVIAQIVGLTPFLMSGIGGREVALIEFLGGTADNNSLMAAGLLFSGLGRILIHFAGVPWMPVFLGKVLGKNSNSD